MQSEVRKVLDSFRYFGSASWWSEIDTAERADAARREEPVIVSDVVAVDCVRCGMHISTTDHAVLCNCGTVIVVHRHDRKVDTAGSDGLRKAVAELVARWMERSMPLLTAGTVRELLNELNAIIATKTDTVEVQQATASGPVRGVRLPDGPARDQWRVIRPVVDPAVADKVYEIATRAVRNAIPDVLDGLAETHKERGWYGMADGIKRYADKLRKERGA